jgi:hypothetical protein
LLVVPGQKGQGRSRYTIPQVMAQGFLNVSLDGVGGEVFPIETLGLLPLLGGQAPGLWGGREKDEEPSLLRRRPTGA